MVFSSIIFLFFFLPVVLVLYYTVCAPSVAMRNGLLLLTSLFFYAWGEPKNVLLLIGSCVLNWGIALAISRWRRRGRHKSSMQWPKSRTAAHSPAVTPG